jgi:hypothetical protein
MLDKDQLEALKRQIDEDYRLDMAAIERLYRRFIPNASRPTASVVTNIETRGAAVETRGAAMPKVLAPRALHSPPPHPAGSPHPPSQQRWTAVETCVPVSHLPDLREGGGSRSVSRISPSADRSCILK